MITRGWSRAKALAWSGLLASALLLASWFNAIATSTFESPRPPSPERTAELTHGDDTLTRVSVIDAQISDASSPVTGDVTPSDRRRLRRSIRQKNPDGRVLIALTGAGYK